MKTVNVYQPWHGELATEIDHICIFSDIRCDLIIGANSDKLAIFNGNRFNPRLVFIDGIDFTVGINGVCRFFGFLFASKK
jgi:hypothetical protein